MSKSVYEPSPKENVLIETPPMSNGGKSIMRIGFIDVAKTFCIFLVRVGHWTNNEMLWIYIYSFHMPAMFAISGYLYKPRLWWETVLSLSIPVLFYSLLNLLIICVTGNIPLENVINKDLIFRLFHYRYGLPWRIVLW